MLRNKFVPSRKKHEPGVGFINDTIQILSQVIVCNSIGIVIYKKNVEVAE